MTFLTNFRTGEYPPASQCPLQGTGSFCYHLLLQIMVNNVGLRACRPTLKLAKSVFADLTQQNPLPRSELGWLRSAILSRAVRTSNGLVRLPALRNRFERRSPQEFVLRCISTCGSRPSTLPLLAARGYSNGIEGRVGLRRVLDFHKQICTGGKRQYRTSHELCLNVYAKTVRRKSSVTNTGNPRHRDGQARGEVPSQRSDVKHNLRSNQDASSAPSSNLFGRLPQVPSIHRPSREELLAAATGFWSRMKIRFKWFSIRSIRPWNSDDISAFFSWFIVGNLIWILLGTTTFFSIAILAVNTVFAQGEHRALPNGSFTY